VALLHSTFALIVGTPRHRLTNHARGRHADEPFMQMNAYRLDAVEELAASLGFDAPVVETDFHGRFLNARLLMRRKAAPGG
jgi:hypothetical protein